MISLQATGVCPDPAYVDVKGKQYLRRTRDYGRVHNLGSAWRTRGLTLKAAPNGLEYSRWGLVAGRRTGNAVTRNRIKRILREIMRKTGLKAGYDLVIVAHPAAAAMDYGQLEKRLNGLMGEAGLAGEQT